MKTFYGLTSPKMLPPPLEYIHVYIYIYTYTGRNLQSQLSYTVCALIFTGFIFRGFAIFAFLNSRLLGTVVLKYLQIYGSCRGAKLAGLIVGFV